MDHKESIVDADSLDFYSNDELTEMLYKTEKEIEQLKKLIHLQIEKIETTEQKLNQFEHTLELHDILTISNENLVYLKNVHTLDLNYDTGKSAVSNT